MLTQYKSHSLDRHITTTWRMSQMLSNYVTPVPAQQRLGPRWYTGSADAILQSLNLVYDEKPDYLVVFGADHVYRMDPSQMVADHIATGAEATVAGIRVPRHEATAFGVIKADDDGSKIAEFMEKPADPPSVPDDPDVAYASMGNYVFTTEALIEALKIDAADESSIHDMGGNIIPYFVNRGSAHVYDFARNEVPGRDRSRPRLLARRRHPGRLHGRAHGSGVAGTDLQSVQPGMADPELPADAAAGEVRRERHRPRFDDRQRHDHLRCHGDRVGGLRRRADRHRQPGRGLGDPARASGSAGTPLSGTASWTRT